MKLFSTGSAHLLILSSSSIREVAVSCLVKHAGPQAVRMARPLSFVTLESATNAKPGEKSLGPVGSSLHLALSQVLTVD